MTRSFIWLDVFTDRAFAGNPLAVFPDAEGLGDAEMAAIAGELNLSETTFVLPPSPGHSHRVRIMTPTRELPFAGHPTVGTAVALAELAGVDQADFVFELLAGPTPVAVRPGPGGSRTARFVAPQIPRLGESPVDPRTLAATLGIAVDDLDPSVPLHVADAGGTMFVVAVVRSPDALGRCRPRESVPGVVGTFVACRTDADEWRSRMFAPDAGVFEDPATGSATCAFAGSLHRFVDGFGAPGIHDVILRQGVEMGRPSVLQLSFDVGAGVDGERAGEPSGSSGGSITEVRLAGGAVVVLRGELAVPRV